MSTNLVSVVIERLTDENLQESRVAHPTGFDGAFYAAFGLSSAAVNDIASFRHLEKLAHELPCEPAVAARLKELSSKGLSVEFTVYGEPAGNFLCILIKDHALYDKARKEFDRKVARELGWAWRLFLWLERKLSA